MKTKSLEIFLIFFLLSCGPENAPQGVHVGTGEGGIGSGESAAKRDIDNASKIMFKAIDLVKSEHKNLRGYCALVGSNRMTNLTDFCAQTLYDNGTKIKELFFSSHAPKIECFDKKGFTLKGLIFTQVGSQGNIYFNCKQIVKRTPGEILVLIASKSANKILINNRYYSNEQPIGPYKRAGDLFIHMGKVLYFIAQDHGLIR